MPEIIAKCMSRSICFPKFPTDDFLLVEELSDEGDKSRAARHYFFHSLIGRAANDALARVVTYRLSRLRGGNAIATPHDYGFVLTVAARPAIQPG
jgi:ATP-dependent Lhr-like helicase